MPLCLVVLALLVLQTDAAGGYIASRASKYLSERTGGVLRVGDLRVSLGGKLVLRDIFVADRNSDTIVSGEKLSVEIDLGRLLAREILVKEITAEGVLVNLSRTGTDTVFNYQYIADAFLPEEKEVSPDTSASPWDFAMRKLLLRQARFTYEDAGEGIFLHAGLGVFDLEMKKTGFKKSAFHIAGIMLEDAWCDVRMDVPLRETVSGDTARLPFSLDVDELELSNIRTNISDSTAAMSLSLALGKLSLRKGHVDLAQELASADRVALGNASCVLNMNSKAGISTDSLSADSERSAWKAMVNELLVDASAFAYHDAGKQRLAQGIDYSHLSVSNISLRATSVLGSAGEVKAGIAALSCREQTGFVLSSMKGRAHYDQSHISVSGLRLTTPGSFLEGDLAITYADLEAIANQPGDMGLNVNLRESRISHRDISYFVPDLHRYFRVNTASGLVVLTAVADGQLNDMRISTLEIQTGETTVALNGRIRAVMTPSLMYMDLPSLYISSAAADLAPVTGDSLPVALPERFALSGEIRGYAVNADAALRLTSTRGSVDVILQMDPEKGPQLVPYDVESRVNELDLGYLLRQPDLFGKASADLRITGSGLDTSNIEADVSLKLHQLGLKGYSYSNLALEGRVKKSSFSGTAVMDDPNLAFKFGGYVNADATAPRGSFTLDLQGAALKALHFSEEDRRVSARVVSELAFPGGGKNPLGSVAVRDVMLLQSGKRYKVDSLVLRSNVTGERTVMTLKGDFLEAKLDGDFNLAALAADLGAHLDGYFHFRHGASNAGTHNQKFTYSFELKESGLLTSGLVPSLDRLSPFKLEGAFDKGEKKLETRLHVPQIRYSGILVDSVDLRIDSDREALKFSGGVAEVSTEDLKFENIFLHTRLADDLAQFSTGTLADDSTRLFFLAGSLRSMNGDYELRLAPQFTLAASPWTTDSSNRITFGHSFRATRVNMSDGKQQVSINSLGDGEHAPVEFLFKQFRLSSVSSLARNQKDLVNGTVDGSMVIDREHRSFAFRSDLKIAGLEVYSAPLGDLTIKADNYEDPGSYHVAMTLSGRGNDLRLAGNYRPNQKNNSLHFRLDVNPLDLAVAGPFTGAWLSRMSGSVSGSAMISGSIAQPRLEGKMTITEAAVRPNILGSYLKIPSGEMLLDGSKIRFRNFRLYDTVGNAADLTGSIDISQLNDPGFDLSVRTQDFLALNTDKLDNPLYYGRLLLNSDITVKGKASLPVIKAKAKLNKGSSLTYVRSEGEVGRDESKGIVEFRDSLSAARKIMVTQDSVTTGVIKGIELDAAISVDREVDVRILIDPLSGDSLYLKGGGLINFSLDRSGNTGLTGRYTISEGGYFLTISDFIKRDFKIQKGSSVSWSGDPLDAYVDINAIYTLKASPVDLVQDQLAGLTEPEKNKYRNLLTFLVFLRMKGFISSPDISFDIQLASADRGAMGGAIDTRLAQLRTDENQLNKQVFALLTLRRFVGESPLESSSDGGFASASRSSASQILTQQLNTFADRYVNFVDLDLGVNSYEDYSSGRQEGRTQVQVGVSKQMFNDRVTVRVGGNVDVEGEKAGDNDANEVAGNISIEYRLTEDGRYRVKAFRENQYENPIEGELTKTGAGFILTRDFNKFRNIFRKPGQRRNETREKK